MVNRLAAASAVVAGISLFGCPPKPTIPRDSTIDYANEAKIVDSGLVKDNGSSITDLAILVDKEFIERYNSEETWWGHFCSEMNFVDEKFNSKFGIDFDVDSVQYFELPAGCPNDMVFLYYYVLLHHKPGQFDAFVYLSGKDCGKSLGVTEMLGNFVVAAPNKKVPLKRVLQHEFSHLYGAEDAKCSNTILSNDLNVFSYEWSAKEADIISKNKSRHWGADAMWYFDILKNNIAGFPETDREDVINLVCYQNCYRLYPEALDLAAGLRKRYPDNELIEECYFNLIRMK